MSTVRRSRAATLPCLSALVVLLASAAAYSSDNSKSSLEVFDLLASAGSHPIGSGPPPPIIIRSKPPSLQLLKQTLAADEQVLADQQAGLTMAQELLAFWQTQPAPVAQINVPNWTQAVATDQNLVATVQARITGLRAQIEAAK